jgi:hypothetical protein
MTLFFNLSSLKNDSYSAIFAYFLKIYSKPTFESGGLFYVNEKLYDLE